MLKNAYIDRDGLIAQEEFLHRSSDFKKDTDDDGIGDFSDIRLGWEVGVVGQLLKRVFPDPARPDSDADGLGIGDGNERLLGSSPNLPGDAVFGGDLDADGLTDVLEALGATIQVTDGMGMTSMRVVPSDPNLPDTDLDGLPDFAERNLCSSGPECPTDPTQVDTDLDGLADFDELSAEQFSALARYNEFFPGFHIDGTTSKKYGTDPTRVDTDGDHLADRDELLVGWTVVRDDGRWSRSSPTRRREIPMPTGSRTMRSSRT